MADTKDFGTEDVLELIAASKLLLVYVNEISQQYPLATEPSGYYAWKKTKDAIAKLMNK